MEMNSSRIIDFDTCPEEGQIRKRTLFHPHELPLPLVWEAKLFITNGRTLWKGKIRRTDPALALGAGFLNKSRPFSTCCTVNIAYRLLFHKASFVSNSISAILKRRTTHHSQQASLGNTL